MQFLILILIVCLFFFLFSLYVFSKDDVVFMRKNIAVDYLFNVAIGAGLFGLLTARIFFVIFHWSSEYINPLVFFIFPYFPGLSLFGGIVGSWAYILLVNRKKAANARILDFFTLSLLSVLPLGYSGYLILSKRPIVSLEFFFALLFILLFLFFYFFLFTRVKNGDIKEGTITYIFLSLLSFISIAILLGSGSFGVSPQIVFQEILVYVFFLVVCIGILANNERLFSFKEKK